MSKKTQTSSETSKKLTEAVIDYQKNEDVESIKNILNYSNDLIDVTIKRSNWVKYFPKLLLDEIKQDCKTLVLLDAIEKFDESKNCEFSTLLYRNLNFYLRKISQHYSYQKRKVVLNQISIDKEIECENENTADLKNILFRGNKKIFRAYHKLLRELM